MKCPRCGSLAPETICIICGEDLLKPAVPYTKREIQTRVYLLDAKHLKKRDKWKRQKANQRKRLTLIASL